MQGSTGFHNLFYPYSYLTKVSCVDSLNAWTLGDHKLYRTTNGGFTNVGNQNNLSPRIYKLNQNYPNPFNPLSTIGYQIPKSGFISIKVYNILGREVATLVNEEKPAGTYEVHFNGENFSSGIYFYKLKAGNYSSIKKMVLIK